ncbi:filamentous hemagglutinin N-terminal domain-containing protein [Yersinia alsatica]|uniref:two-partner secretion domain-containing protein n=1 Tax=Yersinia alsatica TaxID=2890317 RepID=UPI0032F0169A
MGICCHIVVKYKFFIYNFFLIIFYLLTTIGFYSFANIVADTQAPKSHQPEIHHYIENEKLCMTQNAHCQGATFTTVNIVTPNEQGLSHNKYDELSLTFGPGYNKLFFNNQRIDAPGFVGNPHLVDKTAKVILNEVTSNKPSLLHGDLAVIGPQAHVIIANPSGVYCNNCQFSNMGHVTLTTGVPVFNADILIGYDIQQGAISIGRSGLKHHDGSDTFLNLFSTSLTVEGEVRAEDILAVIGKSHIRLTDVGEKFDIKLVDNCPYNSANVAIDVTKLGGMYTNKIFLYANSGGIQNKGIIDAKTVANLVSTSFIKNSSGRIYTPKLKLRSVGDIDNIDGKIKSERHGLDYPVNEKFGVRISGRNVNNRAGSIYANSGYTSIKAKGSFNNWDGVIKSNALSGPADIRIKAKTITNDYGQIVTFQNIQIDASELRNNKGRIISAFKNVDLGYKTLISEEGIIHAGIEVNRTIKP